MIKKTFLYLFIFLCANNLAGCFGSSPIPSAVVTSLSSDGHYAITSHCDQRLILWDIAHHTQKLISTKANIYSAYFIKHSDRFMWQQDDNNQVHIDDVHGNEIMTFPVPFPTYGHVITSDLKHYVASDVDWSLLKRNAQGKWRTIEKDESGFFGLGKLRNLTLSRDDRYLLTAGDGSDWDKIPTIQGGSANLREGIVLWDVKTGKPLMKFPGNMAKTYATLSPDGKYAVSGDENTSGFVWDAHTGRQLWEMSSLFFGHLIRHGKCPADPLHHTICYYDKTGWVRPPSDFVDLRGRSNEFIISVKFIDQTHYLRFTHMIPYAVLYDIHSPKHLKFLPLGSDPLPMTGAYDANTTFDTAPNAHILAIGQAGRSGIIVYQYDPEKQTLTRIWAPTIYDPSPNDTYREKIIKAFHRWSEGET